jgi:regulator of nucleoside diphosphate kinase
MKSRNIVITESDHGRLQRLIESSRRFDQRDAEYIDRLEEELEAAIVVKSGEVPEDIVTMNSRVRIRDLNSGHELTYQIVFPKDADAGNNRISVLAPIGTALLGYGAGTTVEWRVPSGLRRLRIEDVEYQPEAAGAAA